MAPKKNGEDGEADERRGATSDAAAAAPRRRERSRPKETIRRLVQGDLASLRVVIGLALIWAIFQFENDRFLSAQNLTNLMLQITAIGLISVGIVYVLLLGEIDLSVGAVSGLAAAVMAVLNVKHGWNPYLAIAAAVAVGARDRPAPGQSLQPLRHALLRRHPRRPAWPGRARSCRCSARPGRSTSPTPRSPASPTPSTPTRSAGSSPPSSIGGYGAVLLLGHRRRVRRRARQSEPDRRWCSASCWSRW